MPYANRTMKHAREVMAETDRLLRADAEKKKQDETHVDARAHAAKAKPKAATATASARWAAAVAAKIKAGLPKAKAVRAVAIADPELHADYLREFNTAARRVTDLEREVSRLAHR